MQEYEYLLDLAIILLSTKVLGLLTKKAQMPQVVGALLAGVILGPAMLGILEETTFLHEMAEIGVIVLMFGAGMETDINELKASGKASFIIALFGVIVPLLGGFGVSFIFNRPSLIQSDAQATLFLQNVFIGVILTATSVSITVETLKELGKLKTKSGNAILGAAIIDDILGIVALTVVTSMSDSSVHVGIVLLKIAGFFVFSGVVGVIIYKLFKKWAESSHKGLHRHAIIAFVLCLIMAYISEEWFGVADITGAFIAGLIISNIDKSSFVQAKVDTISYMLLSPVFFTEIGLSVSLPNMNHMIILYAALLVIVAIFTKVVGCGIGAKICGYQNYQAKRIGVGMISRGEVALIVASKGSKLELLSSELLGPIVLVVVITTIITPILLKMVFKNEAEMPVLAGKEVTSFYEEADQIRGEK